MSVNTNANAGQPLALYLALIAAAIATYFGIEPIRQTLDMHDLASLDNPYWVPDHAMLLYVLTPLASLAMAVFFLSPGLLLMATYGDEKRLTHWMMAGFAVSLVLIVAATMVFQLITGIVPKNTTFFMLVAVVMAICLGIAVFRTGTGQPLLINLRGEGGELVMAIVVTWAIIALLSPKFYWENFSGDGSGSLQFARNYIHTLWPFWSPDAGTIQKAPGLTSVLFVLPESWYVRLIGETEYSVRVPYMMYMLMLFPLLTTLIRWGRDVAMNVPDMVLLGAALFVYTLSVIYSGGYNPYFGDSPMPAVRETLAVVAFLGFIYFFLDDNRVMMIVMAVLAHTSIPTGGLWLLLWPAAVFVVWRPIPWNRLVFCGFILCIAAFISIIVPILIKLVGLPFPGGEFNAKSIIDRLRYVAFIDWQRFAFPSVPVGIVPALFVLTWKHQDKVARTLTLVSVVFFLFFYAQGYRVLLHHFIPVMMPLLIILWRSDLLSRANLALPLRGAVAVGLAASLYLAWPKEMTMHTFDRHVGEHLAAEGPRFVSAPKETGDRFPGFEPKALDTAHVLLGRLFPIGWRESDAAERFFGAPLAWYFYSEFEKDPDQVVNYVIKPVEDATPEDGRLFDTHNGYGLYIRDEALYQEHYNTKLTQNSGAQIFVVSRDIIFGKGATCCDRVVVDLVGIAKWALGMEKDG